MSIILKDLEEQTPGYFPIENPSQIYGNGQEELFAYWAKQKIINEFGGSFNEAQDLLNLCTVFLEKANETFSLLKIEVATNLQQLQNISQHGQEEEIFNMMKKAKKVLERYEWSRQAAIRSQKAAQRAKIIIMAFF